MEKDKDWYEIPFLLDLKEMKDAFEDEYYGPEIGTVKLTAEQFNRFIKNESVRERIECVIRFIRDKNDIKKLKKVLKTLPKEK